ncbi:MAG: hypothetical protein ACRELE_07755, partial [Gemmatimonadales bacterium]
MKTRVTWVRALGWCSLAWLVVVWIVLDGLGDRVWWTVALVFGPRWVLAAGWLGFVPWLATDARRAMIPALAGLAVALFAVMGIQLGLYRVGVAGGLPYRVLELNADGGTRQAPAILAELRSANADLIVIAECGP